MPKKVFILTEEPYHNNSSILGVYEDEEIAVDAWRKSVVPGDINGEDTRITEWDLGTNSPGRVWYAQGTQISDPERKGWHPIRRDYEFQYPTNQES